MLKTSRGLISVVTGLVLIALGQLAQQLMPVVGRAAYQAAAAGSYSAEYYQLSLTGYYWTAVILIVLGVLVALLECRRSNR